MTTETTSIRERALAALRQHEARLDSQVEKQRARDEVRLTTLIAQRLGIDLEGIAVEWQAARRGEEPVVTVEGIRFRLSDESDIWLMASIPREGCGHEVSDVIGDTNGWVQLGDVIRGAEQLVAEPCHACARAAAPPQSLGERLEAVIREIANAQLGAEIPF